MHAVSGGGAALDRLRPGSAQAISEALQKAYTASPEGLLDLCRARIHMLVGGEVDSDDPQVQAVAHYPRSDLFDDTERLALEFTEQYVLDVANMPDELVTALLDRLGVERLYAFVMGLYAVDQAERLAISAAAHPAVAR